MASLLQLLGGAAILGAAAAAWLALGDRVTPMALKVVELEGQLGVPLWGALLVAGAAALAASRLFSSGAAAPRAPRTSRAPGAGRVGARPPTAQPRPGTTAAAPTDYGGWLSDVESRIGATAWGPGVGVELHPDRPVALEMRLYRQTPEQSRRAVGLLARMLSEIPRPERVRIRFTDCIAAPVPRPKQVTGAFRQHHPADAFHAVGSLDQVDVMFSDPDPRWAEARD